MIICNKYKISNKFYGISLKPVIQQYRNLGLNLRKSNFKIKTKYYFEIINNLDLLTNKNTLKQRFSKFKAFHITMQNYRGSRLNAGYPARGQRTHTNARTARKKI